MRKFSAGVYNVMNKSNRIHQMTASSLLSNVQSNDEHLEANLCTMLQSERGTKHYWFVRENALQTGEYLALGTLSRILNTTIVFYR